MIAGDEGAIIFPAPPPHAIALPVCHMCSAAATLSSLCQGRVVAYNGSDALNFEYLDNHGL